MNGTVDTNGTLTGDITSSGTLVGTIGGGSVISQTKEVTPTATELEVEPDAGYVLNKVTVGVDKAVLAAAELGTDSAFPVELDFTENTGLAQFSGWSRYFRNTAEDTGITAGDSVLGSPRYCKIVLPKDVTTLAHRLFCAMAGLTEVSVPTTEDVTVLTRSFAYCPNLQTVGDLWSKLKYATSNSFRVTDNATAGLFEQDADIVCPKFEEIQPYSNASGYCFKGCAFHSFTAPLLVGLPVYTFSNCTNLEWADFTALASIGNNAFNGCSELTDLYLRGDSVVTLGSTGAFTGTPALTDPTSFTLHVPADLVDSYKAETNWVSLYDSGNGINIVALD